MKIEKLIVKNFRSLKSIDVRFEKNITCLIGENDAGKTAILDAIRVFSDSYQIEEDDFHNRETSIELELLLSNGMRLYRKYEAVDPKRPAEIKCFLKKDLVINEYDAIQQDLLSDKDKKISSLNEEERDKFKRFCDKLGIGCRGNAKVGTILANIEELLQEANDELKVMSAPHIDTYYLDGKKIEHIETVIKELFIRDLQRKLWQQQVSESEGTLRDLVQRITSEKIEEIKGKIEEVKQEIQKFHSDIYDIQISHTVEEFSIPINIKVNAVDEQGNKVSFKKKGDGTKRRVTMALVNYKLKEKTSDEVSIFLFDEPDTHLHVRAQRELMDTLLKYSKDKQIIITTHSPFIINFLKSTQIRLVKLKSDKTTKILSVKTDTTEKVDRLLYSLGIENVFLFFGRKLVIVEEETTERFVRKMYMKLFNRNLEGDFIKIIRASGNTEVPKLAKVILDILHYPINEVFLLLDKDIEDREEEDPVLRLYKEIVKRYPDWANTNVFTVGDKEFEDSFSSEIIYGAWATYLERQGKSVPESWTVENIERLKQRSKTDKNFKFSEKLSELNVGSGIKLNKRLSLVDALVDYVDEETLPEVFKILFKKLQEEL